MDLVQVCKLLLLLLNVIEGKISKLLKDKQLMDTKFQCKDAHKQSFSVANEIQCVHRCLRDDNCRILNYKLTDEPQSTKHNCEIFSFVVPLSSCLSKLTVSNWFAILFRRETTKSKNDAKINSMPSMTNKSSELNHQINITMKTSNTQIVPETQSAEKTSFTNNVTTSLASIMVSPSTFMETRITFLPASTTNGDLVTSIDQSLHIDHLVTSMNPMQSLITGSSTQHVTTNKPLQNSMTGSTTQEFTINNQVQYLTTNSPAQHLILSSTAQYFTTNSPTQYLTMNSVHTITTSNTPYVAFTSQISPKASSSVSSAIVSSTTVFNSCKEVYNHNPNASTGIFNLTLGLHHCVMDSLQNCGQGGWTLALKIDGSQDTFRSNAAHWEDSHVYNVNNGLQSFADHEAKFPAFNHMSFDSICLGMKYSGTTKWIHIPISFSSLRDIFAGQTYRQTSLGRSTWKSLISVSSLQMHCNREGFNVKKDSSTLFARVGIIGNDVNDCVSPNSYIGLGTKQTINNNCGNNLAGVSSGNLALCSPDNGDKTIPTFGYILVK